MFTSKFCGNIDSTRQNRFELLIFLDVFLFLLWHECLFFGGVCIFSLMGIDCLLISLPSPYFFFILSSPLPLISGLLLFFWPFHLAYASIFLCVCLCWCLFMCLPMYVRVCLHTFIQTCTATLIRTYLFLWSCVCFYLCVSGNCICISNRLLYLTLLSVHLFCIFIIVWEVLYLVVWKTIFVDAFVKQVNCFPFSFPFVYFYCSPQLCASTLVSSLSLLYWQFSLGYGWIIVCVCIFVQVGIYVCACACAHMHVYIYRYARVCLCARVCESNCVFLFVCTFVGVSLYFRTSLCIIVFLYLVLVSFFSFFLFC